VRTRDKLIEGEKYSDESGGDPGSDLSDDELTGQNLSFLRATHSRRNISINKKYSMVCNIFSAVALDEMKYMHVAICVEVAIWVEVYQFSNHAPKAESDQTSFPAATILTQWLPNRTSILVFNGNANGTAVISNFSKPSLPAFYTIVQKS